MVGREQPWELMTNDSVLDALLEGERLAKPKVVAGDTMSEDFVDEIYELMRSCWICPPQNGRPRFSAIRRTLESMDQSHHVPADDHDEGMYSRTPAVAESVAAEYYAMRYEVDTGAVTTAAHPPPKSGYSKLPA
jgi:hypothetical protein